MQSSSQVDIPNLLLRGQEYRCDAEVTASKQQARRKTVRERVSTKLGLTPCVQVKLIRPFLSSSWRQRQCRLCGHPP